MIDIVNRLRFDAIRCEATFSKGVSSNITAGADEIELLRGLLRQTRNYVDRDHYGMLAEIDAALNQQITQKEG